MPRYRREDLLTASEIARYVYCQRAWAYDRRWIRSRRQRIRRYLLLLIAFSLLVAAGVFFIRG